MSSSSCCRVSSFLTLPTKQASHNFQAALNYNKKKKQLIYTAKLQIVSISHAIPTTTPSVNLTPFHPCFASTFSTTPALEKDEAQETIDESSPSDNDGALLQPESSTLQQQDPPTLSSVRGCQACGKEEIEWGCNGEGRIQGGIATVPGFGWWPIKAYRPCPSYVATGGRYRRTGQSMDDIGFGGGGRQTSAGINEKAQSSKKKQGAKKSKS